jgi:hypothetical protein
MTQRPTVRSRVEGIRGHGLLHIGVIAVVAVLIVAAIAVLVIPVAVQAHTQTKTVAIGTITTDVYVNYTDGTVQHLTASGVISGTHPLSVFNNGKGVAGIVIVVNTKLNSSLNVRSQAISLGATGVSLANYANSMISVTNATQPPVRYDLAPTLLASGTMNIVSTVSVVLNVGATTALYTGTTTPIVLTLAPSVATSTAPIIGGGGGGSSTSSTNTSTASTLIGCCGQPTTSFTTSTVTVSTMSSSSIITSLVSTSTASSTSSSSRTTTSSLQTLVYPYGLPTTYSSQDGHTWTLMTCSAAEAVWTSLNSEADTCSGLTSVYTISPSVTFISSDNAGTYSINGQICSIAVAGSAGQMSLCWLAFVTGTPGSVMSLNSDGATVYGQGNYMPTGYYG